VKSSTTLRAGSALAFPGNEHITPTTMSEESNAFRIG
jgi:hypothetical protein